MDKTFKQELEDLFDDSETYKIKAPEQSGNQYVYSQLSKRILLDSIEKLVNQKLSELEKELEKVTWGEAGILKFEDAKTIINKYKENGKA